MSIIINYNENWPASFIKIFSSQTKKYCLQYPVQVG